MKKCPKCDTTKPKSEFYKNARSKDGLSGYCRQCDSQRWKKWKKKNPDYSKEWREKNPDYFAEQKRLRTFGITREQYNNLLDQQNNCCAICGGVNENGRTLYVDHDHSCCKGRESCGSCIRQLLCQSCNSGLGFFKDNIELLEAAKKYLERHRQ